MPVAVVIESSSIIPLAVPVSCAVFFGFPVGIVRWIGVVPWSYLTAELLAAAGNSDLRSSVIGCNSGSDQPLNFGPKFWSVDPLPFAWPSSLRLGEKLSATPVS